MFDIELFNDCIKKYKIILAKSRMTEEEEKYKWEAIKCFQDRWDIEAENFVQMFLDATELTSNLLASANNFPRAAIRDFAEKEPETVRAMFKDLFDENTDVLERMERFRATASELCERILPGKQHFQRAMAMSVYLWLRYPDKYLIYKFTDFQKAAEYLKNDFIPKRGLLSENYPEHMKFVDEIRNIIVKDDELIALFNKVKDDTCYSDPTYITLAHDIEIFISRTMDRMDEDGNLISDYSAWQETERVLKKLKLKYKTTSKGFVYGVEKADEVYVYPRKENVRFEMKESVRPHYESVDTDLYYFKEVGDIDGRINPTPFVDKENLEAFITMLSADLQEPDVFWPSKEEYDPGISVKEWIRILQDKSITTDNNLMMFAMMLDYGEPATCSQLAEKYGMSKNHFNSGSSSYAKQVAKKTGCPVPPERINNKARWWPILYVGRDATKEEKGSYIWKLRDELKEALEQIDLPDVKGNKNMNNERMFELNTILYGPPGTGKTYNTVIYAVAIIEKKSLNDVKFEAASDYAEVKRRFEEYKNAGRIAFTTFHQSYGYEEFIEGIKPRLSEDDLESGLDYSVVPGVFKTFCEAASTPIIIENEYGFNKSPVVWKVSLAKTYENPVREECMQNNHIRIGWDRYGAEITDDIEYSGGKSVLNAFVNRMKIGDIVFSCYTASEIDAIGVITGDYEWDDSFDEYKRVRKVNWIVKGIRENIVDLNGGSAMTLSTVYQMKISAGDVVNLISKIKNGGVEVKTTANEDNYVFIIDEINRGNISKIFGELITLIEDKKRIGEAEEMTVTLPYSPNKPFGVPNNVYIIGTMNTADRSIALMDTALRRRFSFEEMMPEPQVLRNLNADKVEGLDVAKMLEMINKRIEFLYDREHMIGHAFFTGLRDDPTIENLARIFKKSIIPLLQEYFYEDYQKIRLVLGDNEKSDERYEFIKKSGDDVATLFKGETQDLFDIPEEKYEINKDAFTELRSYIEIYE